MSSTGKSTETAGHLGSCTISLKRPIASACVFPPRDLPLGRQPLLTMVWLTDCWRTRQVGFILAVAKFVYPSLPVAGVAPIPYRTNDILLQGKHLVRQYSDGPYALLLASLLRLDVAGDTQTSQTFDWSYDK